jgi:hypothetical protein
MEIETSLPRVFQETSIELLHLRRSFEHRVLGGSEIVENQDGLFVIGFHDIVHAFIMQTTLTKHRENFHYFVITCLFYSVAPPPPPKKKRKEKKRKQE